MSKVNFHFVNFYAESYIVFFLLTIGLVTFASPADTLHHWGVSLSGMPSKVVALDKYQRKWMKAGNNGSIALELLHTAASF